MAPKSLGPAMLIEWFAYSAHAVLQDTQAPAWLLCDAPTRTPPSERRVAWRRPIVVMLLHVVSLWLLLASILG